MKEHKQSIKLQQFKQIYQTNYNKFKLIYQITTIQTNLSNKLQQFKPIYQITTIQTNLSNKLQQFKPIYQITTIQTNLSNYNNSITPCCYHP
jgi:hypothetical protein